MDWQQRMNRAIGYIEDNLAKDIDLRHASRIANLSLWEFQRLFSFIAHTSLGDNIRRRRLSLAAEDLRRGGEKIIDIALKYGYDSPASFTRAFGALHGVTPTSARRGGIPLVSYPRLTFQSINQGRREIMQDFTSRGYHVLENGPVYFTRDMDATLGWFEEVLGWYGAIDARDEAGRGGYGCVSDYPMELSATGLATYRGFHLFAGEPTAGVAGFVRVKGLDALHKRVTSNGWEKITGIEPQPWGARECAVTTIDGSVIRFFELDE